MKEKKPEYNVSRTPVPVSTVTCKKKEALIDRILAGEKVTKNQPVIVPKEEDPEGDLDYDPSPRVIRRPWSL